MTTRRRLRGSVLIVTSCLLLLLCAVVGADAEPQREGQQPGLPFVPCEDMPENPCPSEDFADTYQWINFVQLGMTGSPKARQWARIPLAVMGNVALLGYGQNLSNPPEYYSGTDFFFELRTFFVSPPGSEHNYGLSPLIPVRTVAFGSIPVQIDLQIEQRRDANGLPYPLKASAKDNIRYGLGDPSGPTRIEVFPARLEDSVLVRVRRVQVDGVDIRLGSTCRTSSPARLKIESEYIEDVSADGAFQFERFDPKDGFYGLAGGTLAGAIDIPSFTGCGTDGQDDLSPLLTSAISGPGNPVEVVVGEMSCIQPSEDGSRLMPPAPGATTPESINCQKFSPNPNVKPVPDELPFPAEAPRITGG
ncbi:MULTISPECIES: hypothetical protein [unclassified Aeromicrobium]|jgi:hypothetical protein|uniref:hypothetical protein n=1 Tax=unclassified Aeromicrobium TaxID=2633570 RepID=UPI002888FBF7|nr:MULTISPECIES: hypothetical protein [unclassified Aeromicrobium]